MTMSAFPQDNATFLRAIAGDLYAHSWVANIGKMYGGYAPNRAHALDTGTSCYYAIASVLNDSDGRTDSNFEAGFVFVLDDVGTKMDLDFAENFAPAPTYKIETSQGNFQWGYALKEPVTDALLWSAFVTGMKEDWHPWRGASDGTGLAAYKRLPYGKSHKHGFETRLVDWRPEERYSLQELADAFGIDVSAEAVSAQRLRSGAGRGARPSDAAQTPEDPALMIDTIFAGFARMGLLRSSKPGKDGKFDVRCPWAEMEHTNPEEDRATAYQPFGFFKCLHEHCVDRTPNDVQRFFMCEEEFSSQYAEIMFPDVTEEEKESIAEEAVSPDEPRSLVIRPTPFLWKSPNTIPPRKWLYNNHLIRKFVSGTAAAGGTGKSSIKIAEALAMASGRSILGVSVPRPLRVWFWCGEDPVDELDRRVMAAALHHGIRREDIADRLLVDSGRDYSKKIVIGQTARGETTILKPMVSALKHAIKQNRIDVLIVDPFVSAHQVTENDNNAIDMVVKSFADIADDTNCGIELIHHTRKSNGQEATIDSARGAVALIDACRSFHILQHMSSREAESAHIQNPRAYVRAVNGKANLMPPGARANWYHLTGFNLFNGDDVNEGDNVGVAEAWQWPDDAGVSPPRDAGVSPEVAHRIRERFVGAPRFNHSRKAVAWAGHEIAKVLGLPDTRIDSNTKAKDAAGKALKACLQKGYLVLKTVKDTQKTRDVKFVVRGPVDPVPF